MIILSILLAANTAGSMAALIGNDRVTANYPGFRRMPGDTTALAANGTTRGGMTDAIVIRKVTTLSHNVAFSLQTAQRIALDHLSTMADTDDLSRNVLAEQRTTACLLPAYGFVIKRKIRLQLLDGFQEWEQADTYVLALVGRDVWQAAYLRAYAADVEHTIPALITFTGNFCVQQHYRK